MNTEHLIFFIGMPGAGKSYWGSRVAKAHGLPFVDLDKIIEQQEQSSIPDIFAQHGEDHFRRAEQKCLQALIDATTTLTIVACGGGTPCFFNNIELMKAAGSVVYLNAHPYYLYRNLLRSNEARPLLDVPGDRIDAIQALLDKRKHFYERADAVFAAKDVTVTTFDKIIKACTNRRS